MKSFWLACLFLCVWYIQGNKTYRAGVLHLEKGISIQDYTAYIYEAGKSGVDLLVLQSPDLEESIESYDQITAYFSKSAKEANIYLVAPLYERVKCENKTEIVKASLVFDRDGSIIAEYRKPISNMTTCTSKPTELVTFTTNFDLTFGLLMDEDILIQDVDYMKGVKNFIMTSGGSYENLFNVAEFASIWAYVNNVNLISSSGIYSDKYNVKEYKDNLEYMDIHKKSTPEHTIPVMKPSMEFLRADDHQYGIKSLDLETSSKGHKETVCEGTLCCDFDIKTKNPGPEADSPYSLVAFDGVLPVTRDYNIGVKYCGIVACLRNDTCSQRLNTNGFFERVSITANFPQKSVQYPIIESTSVLPIEKSILEMNYIGVSKQVTLNIDDSKNFINVGIFGRDFTKDFKSYEERNNSDYDILNLLPLEDFQGFFDYVWIRLRILIVVVSIYVLEMM